MFRSLEQVQRTIQVAIMMTPIHNSNHIDLYYTLLASLRQLQNICNCKIELSQANTPEIARNAVFGELTDYGITIMQLDVFCFHVSGFLTIL